MMITTVRAALTETRDTMERALIDRALLGAVAAAAALCVERLRAGSKILFCGNGGSAADAQHLAGELVSRFYYDRPGLAAFALTTDTSVLTAIGNDYGYERAFARQVEANGQSGDVLVAISTSGRSPNVLAALEAAAARKLHTIGMTGSGGGAMAGRADILIRAPSDVTPRIQEIHIAVGHAICEIIEQEMFPR